MKTLFGWFGLSDQLQEVRQLRTIEEEEGEEEIRYLISIWSALAVGADVVAAGSNTIITQSGFAHSFVHSFSFIWKRLPAKQMPK